MHTVQMASRVPQNLYETHAGNFQRTVPLIIGSWRDLFCLQCQVLIYRIVLDFRLERLHTVQVTKAFAYLRVSGKGQVDGDGFARQLEAIRSYARAKNRRARGEGLS